MGLLHVPPFMNSYKAHKRMPMIVSLTKLLIRSSIQPFEPPPSYEFFPTRSRNLKFPVSDNNAYITPFIWPFPMTPTTFLLLFTALLRFNDHARYCKNHHCSLVFVGPCNYIQKGYYKCNIIYFL